MKRKMEQRKNEAKTTFFTNTAQGQQTLQEPIMSKKMEQNPWKKSIQCWSCGRNHMHRDFLKEVIK
jgi:hypothetical protein